MSHQTSVSITSDHGDHRLVIDGENVSRNVTNVEVSISASDYPKVDVTFARPHVDLDLTKADVEANVTATQRRLLIAAGWSPPEKTTREPATHPSGASALACISYRRSQYLEARHAFLDAGRALRTELESHCPGSHEPVQHLDRRPPWCNACGYTNDGENVHATTPKETP